MKHLKRNLILGIGLLFFTATPALAGQYVLEKGKGVEVCELYERNLNSFSPNTPFAGGRPLGPESRGFSKPSFESWYSVEKIRGVMLKTEEKIVSFIWERDVNPASIYGSVWQCGARCWHGTAEEREKAYSWFMSSHISPMEDLINDTTPVPQPGSRVGSINVNPYIGRVDIDNDGQPEYIHQFSSDISSSSLIVLNADATDIDYEKTKLTLQHPSRKDQGLPELRKLVSKEVVMPWGDRERGVTVTEDAFHGVDYGIFSYKGKTYFDQWWNRHPDYLDQQFQSGVFKHSVCLRSRTRRRAKCAHTSMSTHSPSGLRSSE